MEIPALLILLIVRWPAYGYPGYWLLLYYIMMLLHSWSVELSVFILVINPLMVLFNLPRLRMINCPMFIFISPTTAILLIGTLTSSAIFGSLSNGIIYIPKRNSVLIDSYYFYLSLILNACYLLITLRVLFLLIISYMSSIL